MSPSLRRLLVEAALFSAFVSAVVVMSSLPPAVRFLSAIHLFAAGYLASLRWVVRQRALEQAHRDEQRRLLKEAIAENERMRAAVQRLSASVDLDRSRRPAKKRRRFKAGEHSDGCAIVAGGPCSCIALPEEDDEVDDELVRRLELAAPPVKP